MENGQSVIIDGRAIANHILDELRLTIQTLPAPPTLVVILIGDNEGSLAYIRQKQKAAEQIGAQLLLFQFPETISQSSLLQALTDMQEGRGDQWQKFLSPTNHECITTNDPPSAIIVQRPLPAQIDYRAVLEAIDPKLDIDGFHPDSRFASPVALAVMQIMAEALGTTINDLQTQTNDLNVTLVGVGDTAGKPIFDTLQKHGITCHTVMSETPNQKDQTNKADILIVAVGKPKLVTPDWVKIGAIVIDVGISREATSLVGDVDPNVAKIARAITPVPGGVGPVNVAYLMKNLVEAAKTTTNDWWYYTAGNEQYSYDYNEEQMHFRSAARHQPLIIF